jgi:hypothetical protein
MRLTKKFSAIRFWAGRLFIATFLSFAIGYIPPTEFSNYAIATSFFLDVIGAYFQWKFLIGNNWKSEFIYSILAFPWLTIWLLYLIWINTLNFRLLIALATSIVWAVLVPIVQPKLSNRLYILSLKVSNKPFVFFLLLVAIVIGIGVLISQYVQVNALAWLPAIALFAMRLWFIQIYVHATWSIRKIS